jgi:alpha-beta hydrolase superfamily lysophospholipase
MTASLVQDVWGGWEPRLRGRRLAPWEPPGVRLLFHLDVGSTLDDPRVAGLLDALGARLEVVAWEPRGQGGGGGRLGAEWLEDARRLVGQGSSRWGDLPLVVGGHGLGGWVALAVADSRGVVAAAALAPSLANAGPEAGSPLRSALAAALSRPSLAVPTLVLEGRERPASEAEAVSAWLAREPRASRVLMAGADAQVLDPPWPGTVAAWAEAAGKAAGGGRA